MQLPQSGAMVACLSDEGVVAISGRHRVRWLNGMVTQDVKSLAPGQGRYGCVVDVKGKVVADFDVFTEGDRFLLRLASARVAPTLEHLRRYVVAEDVRMTDLSSERSVVAVRGLRAAEVLGRPAADVTLAALGGVEVLVARSRRAGPDAWDVLGPADAGRAIVGDLVRRGAEVATPAALEARRVALAVPRFGPDFDETTIPLEARLDDAVHGSKGCYLGQEVIARMAHRGHTNKELRQLRLDGDVPAGAELWPVEGGPKAVGRLTSVAAGLALGWVRREHFAPGTTLVAVAGAVRVLAVITDRAIRATE